MQDAIHEENEQELQEEDSSWEVHSLSENSESPLPSESESGTDEDCGDEIPNKRRRQPSIVP